MARTFFSRKRAEAFAEQLRKNGEERILITAARDAFGQTQYRVEW